MPIDINELRIEKGGNPDKIKHSQKLRFASESLVDEVIELDVNWRKSKYDFEQKKKSLNILQKEIGELKKKKEKADEKLKLKIDIEAEIVELNKQADNLELLRDKKLKLIGNVVHESVPYSKNEDENKIERTYGPTVAHTDVLHHHEILWMIGGYEPTRGAAIAGHRAYFLTGPGVLLNQALINYGIQFLMKKNYTPVQPPFFMNKEVMAETAQLEEFDESLYKVIGNREDGGDDEKYLIATSEQPISAFHRGENIVPETLPLRYAGVSSCFRKEAGSYGRDSWGIFRVHQFEKVEQFCITTPEKSWEMQEEMIGIAEDFYKSVCKFI